MIQTEIRSVVFVGNGVATTFPFSFVMFDRTDVLLIQQVIATGINTILVLDTDYSVTLNADQQASPGGTITYPLVGVPLPATESLTVSSQVPYTQETDLPNGGPFFAEQVETMVDKNTVLAQQLRAEMLRALTLPPTVPVGTIDVTLPLPVPGDALGWDALGTSIVNLDIATQADLSSAVAAAIVTADATATAYADAGDIADRAYTDSQDVIMLAAALAGAAAASGAVPLATMDAVGDLIVGTGNDTVGRLAMGTALQQLRVNAGATALEWGTYASDAALLASADSASAARDVTALAAADAAADAGDAAVTAAAIAADAVVTTASIQKAIVDAAGDLIVGTANDTVGRLAMGTALQVLQVNAGATALEYATPSVAAVSAPPSNLLVNGNWLIDQINEGALYTVSGASATVGPDGWSGSANNGVGVFKMRTIPDPDNAALRCKEITCTTIDAAIGAADIYHTYTAIEGYDIADLKPGLASAGSVTLRFKFKTSVTGVYGLSISNGTVNRSRVEIITVPNTSENEYTVTFPFDQTGAWLYTSGIGLYLRMTFAGGTNFHASAGAWNAGNFYTTSAQCNFMSNVANIAYLKRIQLTPGAIAAPMGPQDFQRELEKCQRYYWKTFPIGIAVAQNTGNTNGVIISDYAYGTAAGCVGDAYFPVRMRALPTVTLYNPQAANANWRNSANNADAVGAVQGTNEKGVSALAFSTTVAGMNYFIHATANARLA